MIGYDTRAGKIQGTETVISNFGNSLVYCASNVELWNQ